MALNKLKFNSLNVTPTAGKAIGFNSSADGLEATLSGGAMRFIKKLTASSSATLSFVNGSSDVVLDSTYKEYIFVFNNIHAATNRAQLTAGFRDGSTNYDATVTNTYFYSYNNEDDSGAGIGYATGGDLAQSTNFSNIGTALDNSNDACYVGYLHLFNPSSTTFVKHFIVRGNSSYITSGGTVASEEVYAAGYCNVTAAIDAVQFKLSSGNIDAGTITLYGIN
jgi:hypothetical protein